MALLTYNNQYLTYNGKLLDASINVSEYTLSVNPTYLAYDLNGIPCDMDSFWVETEVGNEWFISDNRAWITYDPIQGVGPGWVSVQVMSGDAASGLITIVSNAPDAYVDVERITDCMF